MCLKRGRRDKKVKDIKLSKGLHLQNKKHKKKVIRFEKREMKYPLNRRRLIKFKVTFSCIFYKTSINFQDLYFFCKKKH